MSWTGVTRCLVAAVLFGASAPAASVLTDDMPSVVLAGLLYVGAAATVTPSVVRFPPSAVALRRDWRPALIAVVAGGAIGPALLMAGLTRTSAASASILLNLELVATVLLATTVFREYLGRRVIAAAGLITVAGTVLVGGIGAELNGGALLIAAACLAWGLDNCVTARIDQLSPEHVVFLKGAVAGLANLGLGLAFATGASSIAVTDVAAALVIGAFGYGASIVLWVKGARDLGAARGQVIFSAAPFIGAVIAWSLLNEPISPAQIAAVAIAAVGVGISLQSAHDHEHTHEAIEHTHEHHHDDRHDDGHHHHQHPEHPEHPEHSGRTGRTAPVTGRHTHTHRHAPMVHSHRHLPDLHHRHRHQHQRPLPPVRHRFKRRR